ncbi:MAG: hypothetical protein ACRC32_02150 [Chroococcidiopsis sp.]
MNNLLAAKNQSVGVSTLKWQSVEYHAMLVRKRCLTVVIALLSPQSTSRSRRSQPNFSAIALKSSSLHCKADYG